MGSLSDDVGPFELSGNAPKVQDEVGLIAVELVDDVAVAHQVKDGATEVLSLQSCPVPASTPTLGVGLLRMVEDVGDSAASTQTLRLLTRAPAANARVVPP